MVSSSSYSESATEIKDPRVFARKYQLDLCKKAVDENVIVYLGTGCGKTLVSVLLMHELRDLIRKPSNRVCVFLAPTVPLVRQQAMVIENYTDFKVQSYVGAQKSLKDHHDWGAEMEKIEVLVMTPQILLQNLRHCIIRMELIALLIFDECHHAQANKRHPYAEIMRDFYSKIDSPIKPRIFGMTASPIIGKGGSDQLNYIKCINTLENLLDAKMCSVENNLELESYIASPNVKVFYYGPLTYAKSSFMFQYQRKLEMIKNQSILSIRETVSDLKKQQKFIKAVTKVHEKVVFCLQNLGLYGAIQSVQILSTSDQSLLEMAEDIDSSANFFTNQYVNSASLVLSCNIMDDNRYPDTMAFESFEEPFFSDKLSVLIQILSTYRNDENMKCIIFVKRIIVARTLASILGKLEVLDFWKCHFLVGFHSGTKNMSRSKMDSIVGMFRSGEVNLLVATNVAEEGLDIQSCCLVVRFDMPESVASFIQSRGRARMQKSEFVFLIERENLQHNKSLHDFELGENIMNQEVISRSCNDAFDNVKDMIYKVDSTGASISTACGISLLHRYCSKLTRDIYFDPLPKFFYINDVNGTICRVVLPPNAPIRQIDSLPCSSKDEAKRASCLEACIQLHKVGALNDYLLPGLKNGKKTIQTEDISHSSRNISTEKDCLREELHEMLVPATLKESWSRTDDFVDMFLYSIKCVAIPDDRNYREFGLLVKIPLPKEAEMMELDLHLARGRIVKTSFVPLGKITLNKEEVLLAENYQEMFLKIILDRFGFDEDFVTLGGNKAGYQNTSTYYLLLPVEPNKCMAEMIDWNTMRRSLSSPIFRHPTVSCKKNFHPVSNCLKLVNGKFSIDDVLNSLVFTPHNKLFYIVDGIHHNKNAHDQHNPSNASYADHYYERFNVHLAYPEQPLLKAKQLFSLHNLLHNRLKENAEASELQEYFVELPPETCSLKVFGFSKDISSTLSLLPSLMHRLENLLVAIELKNILSEAVPQGCEVRADCILEAITAEKCMERMSLERLEVLGDAFLKYVVGRHIFLSYQGLDEGHLTTMRSDIVNNTNLYELAIAKNLHVYIRNEVFYPKNFFALGRPCTVICNADTESDIHNQQVNGNIIDESAYVKCTKSHRWVHRKTIADVIESLVGAFLVQSGFKAAIAFLKWLGIQVDIEISDILTVCKEGKKDLPIGEMIDVNALENLLGYRFKNRGLLLQAFVHPSYSKHPGGCYQRLEYLGDAVLEYVITSYVYSVFPDLKPGQISDLRCLIANNTSFAYVSIWKSFHEYLIKESSYLTEAITKFKTYVLLSELEKDLVDEPACPKVLGDIVESAFGAILLDTGFNLNVVWGLMLRLLEPILGFPSLQVNSLRELHELCQSCDLTLKLPDPVKLDHNFSVQVEIQANGKIWIYAAVNKNSKVARRLAAQEALNALKAFGYKDKSRTLEESLKSTRKNQPKLIGFDEDLMSIENLDANLLSFNEESEALSELTNPLVPSHREKSDRTGIYMKSETNGVREMTGAASVFNKSAKSKLYELCSANCWNQPTFVCCKEEGPSHLRMFTYKVTFKVQGLQSKELECYSEAKAQKKLAQEHAAQGALWYLKNTGYTSLD